MRDHSEGLDDAVAHRVLASPIRRAVLRDLRSRDSGQATLQSVARSLADHAVDTGPASLDATLHHTHLPKLDAAGVVDYHPDRRTVRYAGDLTVERLMDRAE